MSDKVGIVAVAQTSYEQPEDRWRTQELTYQTVEGVLEETGFTWARDGRGIEGIDATITCSQDHIEGQTISNIPHEMVAGANLKPSVKVDRDGAAAVAMGLVHILSGHYDVVLITACIKESSLNQSIVDNFGFEPIFHRKLGLDFLQAAALQATRYMDKYGISREQCARVVVKNRGNGLRNPYVQFGAELRVEDVLSSEMAAYPITDQEIKPVCDGACTIILAREEKAKKLTSKPVWITGIGQCYDAHNLGERELAESLALEQAAKRACKMAGINEPVRELSLIELSEYYAYQELLWTEGLGLCQRGGGGKFIDSGATQFGGEIPVNPSGGLLSGNPRQVAGLSRVIEGVLQLRGEAGARQVDGATKVLAHGTDGSCGQYHCVVTLEKGF